MKRVRVVAMLLALLAAPGVGLAQTEDHSHHAGSASGGVGTVSFETSCAPAVKEPFNRAVAELHSFWFPEARRALVAHPDAERIRCVQPDGHYRAALGEVVLVRRKRRTDRALYVETYCHVATCNHFPLFAHIVEVVDVRTENQ